MSSPNDYLVLGWGDPFVSQKQVSCWISLLYPHSLKKPSPDYFSLGPWFSYGLELPLEFSCKCDDGSLGLIIDFERGSFHPILCAKFTSSKSIIEVLSEALGYDKSKVDLISFIDFSKEMSVEQTLDRKTIYSWWTNNKNRIPLSQQYKGILWCSMKPNFEPSASNAITYLQNLPQNKEFIRRIIHSGLKSPLQLAVSELLKNEYISKSQGTTAQLFPTIDNTFFQSVKELISKSTHLGRNGYIEYVEGNLPFIISAPHGGNLKPSEIPDRTRGVIDGDTNSTELAIEFFTFLSKACSSEENPRIPHLIICHLDRIKLDANRNLEDAAHGNPFASEAWQEYHDFIGLAKNKVISEYKLGSYYDIHGNTMSSKVMIGYMLRKDDYEGGPQHLSQSLHNCSIRSLLEKQESTEQRIETLMGQTSLATLLEKDGYPSVPIGQIPYDWGGPEYWNGGYNTKRHGSTVNCSPVIGIQIETPMSLRQKEDVRKGFALSLAKNALKFHELHFKVNLIN